MLHTSKLRSRSQNGFLYALKQVGAALVLAILLPAAASAYTVVLRNGRRVEIPPSFSVTQAGITYEYASGLYVTIQMTSIDVAATEQANNEPAGTLLARASQVGKSSGTPASAPSVEARRTLTDKDLEASKSRRVESESRYERRRVELGLPSVEATRRRREEEARRLGEIEEREEAGEAQSESYWRARADELRTEMAVTDAEINYIRAKLSESAPYLPTVSFASLTTFPFVAPGIDGFPRRLPERAPLSARIDFGGGATRGRILVGNPDTSAGYRLRPIFRRRGAIVLPVPVFAPYQYNYSYSWLIERLHELEAERAGLQARWRLLEDEARRAGALPGWLRP
jgi:hypothetical protein